MRLGMWLAMAGAVAASALSAPVSAQTSEAQNCKVFARGVWQELGAITLADCLRHIDADVANYGKQGFKFGQWGDVILSADRSYFYRSDDRGGSWRSLGSKQAMQRTVMPPAIAVAPQPTPAPAPEPLATTPVPQTALEMSLELTPQPTPVATPAPTPTPLPTPSPETETETVNPYIASPIPPGETFYGDDLPMPTPIPTLAPPPAAAVEVPAPTPAPRATPVPTPVATPAPAKPTPALVSPIAAPDYRACSVKVDGEWSLSGATSLIGCARTLRDGPGGFNEQGYKFGYWGKIYLLGTREGVMVKRSPDAEWESLPLGQ
ncbi:hypothetical protein E4T66_03980 [Sinimarinibacterium sp. CAU 1509]|uniref:hypothetical protein n=1 Tax=Sinimarinibacterium sp. CAU 1509 TaxID=2562283 RepID=UPI0010ACC50D|nr:hypothetical protein [Sinimarinibacterium sp. CAU 1509]TJY62887.1 hypothetical protein E4T66_03980 [Sinimarinibacterium sp. CAU 1509]